MRSESATTFGYSFSDQAWPPVTARIHAREGAGPPLTRGSAVSKDRILRAKWAPRGPLRPLHGHNDFEPPTAHAGTTPL
jgi:hypothetical protein